MNAFQPQPKPEIKNYFLFIATLSILAMLSPLNVDMYLPAFINIAQDLNVESEQVQNTLAAFAYGLALGQLFWGPFGDSFGRKPIILFGVIISSIASLALTQVKTIDSFTILRFVQGFFGATPVVLSGALLRDLFDKDQLSKTMSSITLVVLMAPLVAPIIGGYIVHYWHWHAIFYVSGIMGVFSTLLVFFIIPETHNKEKRTPLHLNIIARNFVSLWRQKEVLGYMFMSAFGFAGMFAFLTAGSIVYIGVYGVATENFGYFFMLNIAIMTLGSFINSRLVLKIGTEKLLRASLVAQSLAGAFLACVAIFDLGFWPMALGVAIFVGQNSVLSANSMASILEKFPHMAGTSNSMAGSVRFGIGAITGSIVAQMKMTTATPMLLTMTSCVAIAAASYFFLTAKSQSKR